MAVNEEREDRTVSGTTKRGFAGGLLEAVQNRFLAATGRERRKTNPDWLANNHEVLAVNTEIMAATTERITLLGHEVQAWKGSLSGEVTRLLDERAQAVEDLRALQESMAYDQVNVDRMNMSYWPADVQARRQKLSQLQGANDQLREQQLQRAPVRQSKFVKGYIALSQSRIFGSFDPGQHEESPSWEENTRKAGSVNRQFMQDSATTLAVLERAIATTDPLDSPAHLVGLHSDVTGAREAVADMISEDDHTKDVRAWAWTDEQMAAQENLVRGLHRITQSLPGQSQRHAPQAQPKAAEIAPEEHLSAERQLRGIDSRGAARQPGVEPATGLAAGSTIPARNVAAAQRTTHRRAATGVAKSAARPVVMNPQHAAGLQDLEDRQDDSLESGGGSYGR